MPTIITIDSVTLTLKKYPEFTPGTPIATDITLFSDAVNGDLFKTTMDNLIANILYVDGVTITGDGSSGSPLVAAPSGSTRFGYSGEDDTAGETRSFNAGGFNVNILGTIANPDATLFINNTGTGKGISVESIDDAGIHIQTTNNYALVAGSTNADCLIAVSQIAVAITAQNNSGNNASSDTMIRIIRGTSGSPANGIGGSIDFNIQNSSGIDTATELRSIWTDKTNASRTSRFIIAGVDSAVTRNLAYFNGNGFIQLPGLGSPSVTLEVDNAGGGDGVQAYTSTGTAITGFATDGVGVLAQSTNNRAFQAIIQPSSTNNVQTVAEIFRLTSGTGANGIGGSIDIFCSSSTTGRLSNQIISKLTDATDATRTSQAIIKGVLSASMVDLITLNADGSWQIRPITATAASAITPAEGMMLFVSTTDATFTTIGFWGYANGAWAAF